MADLSLAFDPNKISAASDSASDAISKCAANSDAASNALSKISARSAVWDVACTHYDIKPAASITSDDGVDQNRNTAGSFTSQSATITLLSPVIITLIKWDFRNAATYTLTIDGVQFGSPYIAADVAEDATFTETKLLQMGSHTFKVTRNSSGKWSDKNAASYSGTLWKSTGITYDTTGYSYTVPMKMTGYVGSWAVCGT